MTEDVEASRRDRATGDRGPRNERRIMVTAENQDGGYEDEKMCQD
jgi:hypothetical protein